MAEWLRFVRRGYPSLLLALQSVLGVLQLLDVLRVEYVLMSHRLMVDRVFELPVSLVLPLLVLFVPWALLMALRGDARVFVLPLLSVLAFPVLGVSGTVSVASLLAVAGSLFFHLEMEDYLTWVFLFLAGFEALSLTHWLVFLPLGLRTPFESIAQSEMELWYMTLNFSPYLILTFVFVCLLKPLRWLMNGRENVTGDRGVESLRPSSGKRPFFLVLIVCFSVLAAFYPYLPGVNRLGGNVGVDVGYYLERAELIEGDPTQLFNFSSGERSLTFLLIFGFQRALGLGALTVIRYLPVFLNPLIALSAYFFADTVFGDKEVAEWASFFTVFGFHIAAGMYAYYLTNMLGLCLICLSLGFLFRSLKEVNRGYFVVAFLFGALLLFTHPWTFDQYIAPLILVLLIAPWVYDDVRLRNISKGVLSRFRYVLFFFLFVLFVVELLVSDVFLGYGGMAALDTLLGGLTSVSHFWYDLVLGMSIRFGGVHSNVVLVGLALVGVVSLRLRVVAEWYLWFFLSATSALFLIGNAAIKSRLFYNIPIGVLSAQGYLAIKDAGSDEVSLSFSSFIFSSMVVYLFRSLANLT